MAMLAPGRGSVVAGRGAQRGQSSTKGGSRGLGIVTLPTDGTVFYAPEIAAGARDIPAGFPAEFAIPLDPAAYFLGGSRSIGFTLADGTALVSQYDCEAPRHADGSVNLTQVTVMVPSDIAAGTSLPIKAVMFPTAKSQPASGLTGSQFATRGTRLRVKAGPVGGPYVWYSASIADALASGSLQVIKDGRLEKGWNAVVPLLAEAGGAPEGDLHVDFTFSEYASASSLAAGHVRVSPPRLCNGYVTNLTGVNREVAEYEFIDSGAIQYGESALFGNARTWQINYRSSVALGAVSLQGKGGELDEWASFGWADYCALHDGEAYYRAKWWLRYPVALKTVLPIPTGIAYWSYGVSGGSNETRGWDPLHIPGEANGVMVYVDNYGDNADFGSLGPIPSWGVAHLMCKDPAKACLWRRVDLVMAAYHGDMPCSCQHEQTGLPPVLNKTDGSTFYAADGMGVGRGNTYGCSAGGNQTNPAGVGLAATAGASSGGWSAVDKNTPGGAFRFNMSHGPNPYTSAWALLGRYWVFKMQQDYASFCVMQRGNYHTVPYGADRWTLGGVLYLGIILSDYTSQVREKWRAFMPVMDHLFGLPWFAKSGNYWTALVNDNLWTAKRAYDDGYWPVEHVAIGAMMMEAKSSTRCMTGPWQQDFAAWTYGTAIRRWSHAGAQWVWDHCINPWVMGRADGSQIFRACAQYIQWRVNDGGIPLSSWTLSHVAPHLIPNPVLPLIPDNPPLTGLENGLYDSDGDGTSDCAALGVVWSGSNTYNGSASTPGFLHGSARYGQAIGDARSQRLCDYLDVEYPKRTVNPASDLIAIPRYSFSHVDQRP